MSTKKTMVESLIVNARNHLLDTSFNNRMINSKITLSKGLSFQVEDLNNFYELVTENNAFSFLPLENRKKETKATVIENKNTNNVSVNKNYDKVGNAFGVSFLDSNNKPSLCDLKFSLNEGDSQLIYNNKKETEFVSFVEDIYKLVKKNATKYGITEDNIYNQNIVFSGFKKQLKSDIKSLTLSLYIGMVSVLKNEGIPKNYLFLGDINEKLEIVSVKNIQEKVQFASTKGYTKIFVPKKNKTQLKNIDSSILNTVEIVYLSNIDEAILSVFDMVNSVNYSNSDDEFIVKKHHQLRKVFYVNYNTDDLNQRVDNLYAHSKRHIEEQGVNILFLALAFVQWHNPQNENEMINSPLVFVPVDIEASNYKNVYKFSYANSEVLINKSLIKKLELEYNLDFSTLSQDIDEESEFDCVAYLNAFYEIVNASGYDFGVDYNSIHLSFYSYNKFLMYNDLDPQYWQEAFNGKKKNILTDIFVNNTYHETSNIDDDKLIDSTNEINNISNVLDADSSQLLAISKVNRGSSIIIQGPPGTGKSQTIVNIIAESVRNDKKVLFMSEKLSAMEVVYNRLKAINLNHIALQLHSDKVSKSEVIRELESIYYMNKINVRNQDKEINEKLNKLRQEINQYYELLSVKSLHSNHSLIDIYHRIIELENYFDEFTVPHYHINIDNPYLQNIEDSSYNDIFEDLQTMERFYSKYGVLSENALQGLMIQQTFTHHDLVKYSNVMNDLVTLLNTVLKNILINKTIFKNKTISILDIEKLLAIKVTCQSCMDSINGVNYKLILENKEKLDKLMKYYQYSLTDNGIVNQEVINKITSIKVIEKTISDLDQYITFFQENKSFIKNKEFKENKGQVVEDYFVLDKVNNEELIESLRFMSHTLKYKLFLLKEKKLLQDIFGKTYVENNDFSTLYQLYQQLEEVYEKLDAVLAPIGVNNEVYFDFFKKFITKNFNQLEEIDALIKEIQEKFIVDNTMFYGCDTFKKADIRFLISTFKDVKDNLHCLNDITIFKGVKQKVESIIDDDYLKSIIKSEEYSLHISKAFDYIRCHCLVDEILENNPTLETFNKMIFEQKIREFVLLDNKNIEMNNLQRVLDAHFYNVYKVRKEESLPLENKDDKISYLLQTFNKKHNVPTTKHIMRKAFEPITKLKPVFLMSPISISQYLEPIVGLFDVVIFDEASQIKPQDAFGALLRGKQVVVVGDEKQLPPTNFFENYYGNIETFEEDEIANYESILTLLRGSGVPLTILNWHYRSKHHNLIAISNDYFYDNSLAIFPSKYKNNPEYGLKLEYVDGVFDRGKSRTNKIEAEYVVSKVIEHIKAYPTASLGVATLNINQRDLILSIIKKQVKDDMDLYDLLYGNENEPFFVKNLENVQGDEREVIFISIGYAKDPNGNIIQNFGAINHVGGERRLNVLMTRARKKCVIYTGLHSTNLELDYNTSEGVKVLRKFLEFGERAHKQENESVSCDTKIFAMEIAEELNKQGYLVEYNIGNANYFVDLAIINPDEPTEYILGIEFDNSSYLQSRSASERERIRNEVMRSKGWNIYKVYLTSWFNNRSQVITDIFQYLSEIEKNKHQKIEELKVEFYEEPVHVVTRFGFDKYVKFTKMIENINFFMKETDNFTKYISEIIYVEMPIKLNRIIERVMENSHLETKEKVIKKKAKKILKELESEHMIYSNNDFYYYYQKDEIIKFRDRRNIINSFGINDISNEEYIHAILEIAKSSFGINTKDIALILSNYLAFDGVNEKVLEIVEQLSIRLVNNGQLVRDQFGNLQINCKR